MIRPFIMMMLAITLIGCGESPEEKPSLAVSSDSATDVTQSDHPGAVLWADNCKVCHSVGLAGAPIVGNESAWSKRLQRGKASLYTHALEGWGDMPARGGNADLTDEQVKLAVDFMLAQLRN